MHADVLCKLIRIIRKNFFLWHLISGPRDAHLQKRIMPLCCFLLALLLCFSVFPSNSNAILQQHPLYKAELDDGGPGGPVMLHKGSEIFPLPTALSNADKSRNSNQKQQKRSHGPNKGCERIFKRDWKKLQGRCQVAEYIGRRPAQEDRTFCALDLVVPWPGVAEIEERKIGLLAVFDGHGGSEASEMAANLLPEFFLIHTHLLFESLSSGDLYYDFFEKSNQFFKSDQKRLLLTEYRQCLEDTSFSENNVGWNSQRNRDGKYCLEFCRKVENAQYLSEASLNDGLLKNFELHRSFWIASGMSKTSLYHILLKEALLRAIHDIDSTFTKEALQKNLQSGTTATIVLKVDRYILIANIGDSKALLCSACSSVPKTFRGKRHKQRMQRSPKRSPAFNNSESLLCAKDLTNDHRPDRHEEKARIEASGGIVSISQDVSRVNGELAISRAIGDIPFKKYGVISEPEITDWQLLSANDSYLVVASDGIFEKMNAQDLCNVFFEIQSQKRHSEEHILDNLNLFSLALVREAFHRGSMDNLAAVVLPLSPMSHLVKSSAHSESLEEDTQQTTEGDYEFEFSTSWNLSDHELSMSLQVPGMPLQGRRNSFDCYHLIENLGSNKGILFLPHASYGSNSSHGYDVWPKQILPVHWEPQLHAFHTLDLCLSSEVVSEHRNEKCLNPEGFASFYGIIRSLAFDIPLNASEASTYDGQDFRYFLKRKFGRGSFGEVWLAFRHSCSEEIKCHLHDNTNTYEVNEANTTQSCLGSENTFVLKHIMVEGGKHAYLSGLREKHFGDVFLKASSLGRNSIKDSLSEPLGKSPCLSWLVDDVLGSQNPDNNSHRKQSQQSVHGQKCIGVEEGLNRIVRYVESIETKTGDFWLVFHYEGLSLSKLIYTAQQTQQNGKKEDSSPQDHFQILQPSSWWLWLKQAEEGNEIMRNIVWQLLLAIKACHDRNITHRDIKPENMVICVTKGASSNCLRSLTDITWPYNLTMRLIDFGSAIDRFTLEHLYGANGPSRAEQTLEYSPPEAFLQNKWFNGAPQTVMKYDMWSIGVVMLELILGTPHVFQINSHTRALIDKHLHGWNEVAKELAYKLRALMELCILLPGSYPYHHHTMADITYRTEVWPASWECSEEAFAMRIQERDPLKLGFSNIWALRLVRQLLQWHPEERLSVEEALQHPYFTKAYRASKH